MGSSLSGDLPQLFGELEIDCKLVVDNEGQFAGLAPVESIGATEGRAQAFNFANTLVDSLGKDKGFNPDYHNLKIPGVPAGAVDIGVHSSTHNVKFNGTLTAEQIKLIKDCKETFKLTVDLTDFKVLVGSPSNDARTGVVGYVGLLITPESLPEYNRAMAVYGTEARKKNIAHVSICGWDLKGFASTTEARAAFGLVTVDGEKYPGGMEHYTANVFPSLSTTQTEEAT